MGRSNQRGGSHLVNWTTVTVTRISEALCVGDLQKKNDAFLAKWLWRYSQPENALWKKVIKSNLATQSQCCWIPCIRNEKTTYTPWKNICKKKDLFDRNITYKARIGDIVKFWDGPL